MSNNYFPGIPLPPPSTSPFEYMSGCQSCERLKENQADEQVSYHHPRDSKRKYLSTMEDASERKSNTIPHMRRSHPYQYSSDPFSPASLPPPSYIATNREPDVTLSHQTMSTRQPDMSSSRYEPISQHNYQYNNPSTSQYHSTSSSISSSASQNYRTTTSPQYYPHSPEPAPLSYHSSSYRPSYPSSNQVPSQTHNPIYCTSSSSSSPPITSVPLSPSYHQYPQPQSRSLFSYLNNYPPERTESQQQQNQPSPMPFSFGPSQSVPAISSYLYNTINTQSYQQQQQQQQQQYPYSSSSSSSTATTSTSTSTSQSPLNSQPPPRYLNLPRHSSEPPAPHRMSHPYLSTTLPVLPSPLLTQGRPIRNSRNSRYQSLSLRYAQYRAEMDSYDKDDSDEEPDYESETELLSAHIRGSSRFGLSSNSSRSNMGTQLLQLSLLHREINENDYELLLTLDEQVPNKNGAPAHLIQTLPTHTATTEEDHFKCCICLSEVEDEDIIKELPCRHQFHSHCIDTWLKINNTCPIDKITVKYPVK